MTRRGGAAVGLLLALLGLLLPALARSAELPGASALGAAATSVAEVSAETSAAVLSALDDATGPAGLTGPDGTTGPAPLAVAVGLVAAALAAAPRGAWRAVHGQQGRAPPAQHCA